MGMQGEDGRLLAIVLTAERRDHAWDVAERRRERGI